jgi:transposase
MATYSDEFRDQMVKKMLTGRTATSLADEVNVPQPTLSNWLKKAALRSERATAETMKRSAPTLRKKASTAKSAAAPTARRPSEWTAEEKFAAVMEAAGLPNESLGEWLRTNGLHEADLAAFREEVREAAVAGMSAKRVSSPDAKRVKELERELRRKEAALAETAALLVLRKKAVALWGEEGEDT